MIDYWYQMLAEKQAGDLVDADRKETWSLSVGWIKLLLCNSALP